MPLASQRAADAPYLAALANFQKFSPRSLAKILKTFPTAKEAFQSNVAELVHTGIGERIAEEFVIARRNIDPERVWERMEREEIKIITVEDEAYPPLLAAIYDPPAVLFYRGILPPRDALCFGVVGPRLMTPYGKQMAEEITSELARNGLTITSGLAIGIDGVAHEAALTVGGATVAVLGSGIDRASVYPGRHRALADRIATSNGAVLSEYPPGTLPLIHHFPTRNRIVAGLAIGVLVVEAREHSGALITARVAAEEGRDVFAVPGPANQETSFGSNMLIKNGAFVTTGAQDVLDVLGRLGATAKKSTPKLTGDEATIYETLTREAQHIDALATRTKLDTNDLVSTLSLMELKGLVRNVGGMHYVKNI